MMVAVVVEQVFLAIVVAIAYAKSEVIIIL